MVAAGGVGDLEIERGTLQECGGPLPLIVSTDLESQAVSARRDLAVPELCDTPVGVSFAGPVGNGLVALDPP